MSPVFRTSFKDWQVQQSQDPEFVAESLELEVGYQIARLRIQRGLTQSQLAERVGTRQSSITQLENGNSDPSLSYLQRVAAALDARIEFRIIPLKE
jgi:DNA-binding XRE family transcriptional regulator